MSEIQRLTEDEGRCVLPLVVALLQDEAEDGASPPGSSDTDDATEDGKRVRHARCSSVVWAVSAHPRSLSKEPIRRSAASGYSQRFAVILASWSLLGCATHTQSIYKSYDAKAPDAQIETVELTQEMRPYEVLGVVFFQPLPFMKPAVSVEKLQAEARKMGADAISTPRTKYDDNNSISLEAKAIRWIQLQIQTDIPNARLSRETYTSPDRAFTLKMPTLGTPPANSNPEIPLSPFSTRTRPALGTRRAKVEERQVDGTTRGVFLTDDFGIVYSILQMDNRQSRLTLEQQAEQFQKVIQLLEKQFVETSRGPELRMAGIHEGASPIVSRNKEQGRWVERKKNLIEAGCVFRHGDYFYLVVAGVTSLNSPRDPGTLAEAKARLKVFLDGLNIY